MARDVGQPPDEVATPLGIGILRIGDDGAGWARRRSPTRPGDRRLDVGVRPGDTRSTDPLTRRSAGWRAGRRQIARAGLGVARSRHRLDDATWAARHRRSASAWTRRVPGGAACGNGGGAVAVAPVAAARAGRTPVAVAVAVARSAPHLRRDVAGRPDQRRWRRAGAARAPSSAGSAGDVAGRRSDRRQQPSHVLDQPGQGLVPDDLAHDLAVVRRRRVLLTVWGRSRPSVDCPARSRDGVDGAVPEPGVTFFCRGRRLDLGGRPIIRPA
jgi:hypothetical protein